MHHLLSTVCMHPCFSLVPTHMHRVAVPVILRLCLSEKEKRKMVREVSQLCLNRPQKLCNFLGIHFPSTPSLALARSRSLSLPPSCPL